MCIYGQEKDKLPILQEPEKLSEKLARPFIRLKKEKKSVPDGPNNSILMYSILLQGRSGRCPSKENSAEQSESKKEEKVDRSRHGKAICSGQG